MEMYGIKFSNRTKRSEDGDLVERRDAEFSAFAALCASIGVSGYVREVECSSHVGFYDIQIDPDLDGTDISGKIDWAADKTLTQFAINLGCVACKGDLDKEA